MWQIVHYFLKLPCRHDKGHFHSPFISQSKTHVTPNIKGMGQSNPTTCPEEGLDVLNNQN